MALGLGLATALMALAVSSTALGSEQAAAPTSAPALVSPSSAAPAPAPASLASAEAAPVHADDDVALLAKTPEVATEVHPYTVMLVGVGLYSLPAAEICPAVGAACEPGENSLALSAGALVRIAEFGIGAGTSIALGLRPSATEGPAELERRHSRAYLTFDALFRYHPPTPRRLEWWVGTTAGVVALSDSYTTASDRDPYSDAALVGPKRLTLRTEGLSLGLAAGATLRFADRWFTGTQVRYANWIFPSVRDRTPLGDSASLAGRIDVVDFGLLVGFRTGI